MQEVQEQKVQTVEEASIEETLVEEEVRTALGVHPTSAVDRASKV